jgi:hypothetical protein
VDDAGRDRARAGHEDLDRAERGGDVLGERGDRRRVLHVQRVRDRLPAVVPDPSRQLLAALRPARAERDRVAGGREPERGRGADAGRRAGHDRRAARRLLVLRGCGHQRTSTDAGTSANPRTFAE